MNFSLSEIERLENDLSQKHKVFRESIDSLREEIDSMSLYWKSDDTNTYDNYKTSFNKKYQILMDNIIMIDKLLAKINEKKILLQDSTREINSYFD